MSSAVNMRRSSQRWLLGSWQFPIVMIWAVLLPIELAAPAIAIGACFGVLFALPDPPDTLDKPVTEQDGVITMYAEPWGEIPSALAIGAACSVVAGAIGFTAIHEAVPVGLSALGFASAVAGGIRAHARHNVVEIRLTPTTLVLPSRTIALASIRAIECRGLRHHLERGHFEYQQRILRLHLRDDTCVRVPLPMEDDPGDYFADTLDRRVAAAAQPTRL